MQLFMLIQPSLTPDRKGIGVKLFQVEYFYSHPIGDMLKLRYDD